MSLRLLKPLAWIAVYLALIEVGLEFRAHQRGWDTLLFGAHAAVTANGHSPTEYGPAPSFNFRSHVIEPQKIPGVLRCWIASSSHAEDTTLPANEVFPNRLERMLCREGCTAQVINGSRAGQNLAGHIDLARTEGPRWQPDVVILYQMSNDIALLSRRFAGELAPPEAPIAPAPVPFADRFIEQTSAWALLKTNMTSLLVQQRVLRDGLGDPAAREFEASLRRFVAAWKQRGSTVVLCTFATSHDARNIDKVPTETVKTVMRFNMHLSMRGWVDTVNRWNDVIRRVAADEHLAVIDVQRAIGGKPELFRDFVHFTPAGHELVARTLADEMRQQGLTTLHASPALTSGGGEK